MAYGLRQKNEVKKNYTNRMLPLTQAAKLANVPVSTARRWKSEAFARGEDWDELRAASAITSGGRDDLMKTIVNNFVVMFQSTMDSLQKAENMPPETKVDALASLSDAFAKTMKSAGAASPELSRLAIANDIIQLMGDFVREKYPQHINAFIEILEPFGEEVSRNYGR
nr:MAG TPA: Protein of unknown function (DUF1804) [Caudoviricetes sp.]